MSEISTYETTNDLVTDGRVDKPESLVPEYVDPEFDDTELYSLVAANANVVVRFGGAEMTLSEAMWQIPITRENLPSVVSLVRELLANRVEEELEREDEPEEESAVEEETSEAKESEQKKPEKIDVRPEPEKPKIIRNEKQPEKSVEQKPPIAKEDRVFEPKKSKPDVIKAATSSKSFVEAVARDSAAESEIISASDNTESPARRAVPAKSVQEAAPGNIRASEIISSPQSESEPSQSLLNVETVEVTAPAIPTTEASPPPDNFHLTIQENESADLTAEIEVFAEVETTETPAMDLDNVEEPEFSSESSVEEIEIFENELTLAPLGNESEVISMADFIAEDLPIDYLETIEAEPGERELIVEPLAFEGVLELDQAVTISHLDTEPVLPDQPEYVTAELAEDVEEIEEVESLIVQLAERIENSEPETTEIVSEILDKIIDVPAKLKDHKNEENVITEAQAKEELEELFTELLSVLGVDYTPELIESLVNLTLRWRLADEVVKLNNEKEADEVPQDSGTHEIIKKLLVALAAVKKAMMHAYTIGKSALRLYSFSLSPVNT